MHKYLFLLVFLISSSAFSASGSVQGRIEYIRVHDPVIHSADWAPPIFWFTLEGVSAAGTCNAWDGNTMFVMDADQAYSMVLGAYMAGKAVAVRFDDTVRAPNSQWCKATHITIGDPPPSR